MKTQLQFSLGATPSAGNLAARHQKLEPILVEKVGHSDCQRMIPPLSINVQKPLQFNVLSKDKLEMAVQLAKRDMKKKKAGEQVPGKNYRGHGRSRSRSPSPQYQGHTRIVKSRECRERQRRQEIKKKTSVLHVRERVGKGNFSKAVKQKSASTSTRPAWNSDAVNAPSNLPATTNSPPTKDAYLNPRKALTKDEQQTSEISRLQCEIQLFLSKIQTLVQSLVDGGQSLDGVPKLRGKGALYLGEEEGEVRRKMRMEEQAARSARTLYFLKQQVRGIQEDFTRFGAEKIRQTKKSQTLTRLLSALRGAVRALQTFITQLQSHMTRDGPPQVHAELSALMKQLISLCSQMGDEEVDEKQTGPTNTQEITRILDLLNELFLVWEQEAQVIRASEAKEPSPDRQQRGRNRDYKHDGVNKRQAKARLGRNLSPAKSKAQALRRQPVKPSSPERKAALKAGIAALLNRDAAVQQLTAVRGDDSGGNTAAPKGLLLPQYLQQRGRPVTQSSSQGVVSGHYAEPTMAFSLKAVGPQRNPITQPRSNSAPTSPRPSAQVEDPTRSAPWIPSGTPQRPSPKHTSSRSRSHSPQRCGTCAHYKGNLEDVSLELLSEERKHRPVKGHVHFERSSPISRSRSPSPSLRRRKRSPAAYNSGDIQRRLEPLYSQSDMLSKKQETRAKSNLERRKNFRLDTDLDKQTQGEVLTELLFNDLLTEAAEEFQSIEGDNSVSNKAQSLLHNPSLEVMMQKLEQMEIEEEEIRRRWTSVHFGSEAVDAAPSCIMPRDPTPMEVSSSDQGKPYKWLPSNQANLDPILFTKSDNFQKKGSSFCPLSTGGNSLNQTRAHNSISSLLPSGIMPQIKVELSAEILKEIRENVETYEKYLKRNCHHAAGEFSPWQLVTEVSDEILEECLTEVAGELEDMSSDIVNHLYKAEFAVTSDTPPAVAS